MSLQIGNAFQVIIGKDGSPLDAGFVYIGESGQNAEAYPVQVFYDEDLTIPAPQPLRTINGYFSRNGSAAKIFCGVPSCSIIVRDKNKVLQWLDLGYTGILNQEIQDEVKRGIANKYNPNLTYQTGNIVLLNDGTEVISTIPNNTNDPNVNMTGWISLLGGVIGTSSSGLRDGDNITDLIQFAIANGLHIDLEEGKTFTTSLFDLTIQAILLGEGSLKYIYDYLSNDNTENVAPKIAKPYKKNSKYGWYDSVQARGNFEHGAGYGLIVNDDTRPQVCGFRTKQQQKDYPSVDMVGLYTHVASPRSVFLSNCTFTSNTVSSSDLTSAMDIRVGDFIRTAIDPAINMPWRSEITSIDFETKTLGVTWWLYEIGNGDGIPPNGLTCEAPYANGLWGHNTNVYLYNGRPAQTIIGYELGVYSEKTRDKFTSIDGFLVVNLTSQVARTQHAFKISGTWDKGLGAYNCIDAVYTDGTTKNGLNFAPTSDADSSAIRYDLNTRKTGKIIKSVAGNDDFFSISALGVVSHERKDYRVSSADDTQIVLDPTLVFGANATAAHTTTIDTNNMPPKTLLTFRQLNAVNWTIVAGSSSFVLNTSSAMDYLQLFYDGSGFLKLFAGKSL